MRLPRDKDEQAEFWIKVLFVLFVFFLFIALPGVFGKSKAAYNSGDTGASASGQQTLTLVILPALDVQPLGERTEESPREITKTLLLGVRVNTAWSFEAKASGPGLLSQPLCTTRGQIGERNKDDGFQLLEISCRQPLSWGDNPGTRPLKISYEVQPSLLG